MSATALECIGQDLTITPQVIDLPTEQDRRTPENQRPNLCEAVSLIFEECG